MQLLHQGMCLDDHERIDHYVKHVVAPFVGPANPQPQLDAEPEICLYLTPPLRHDNQREDNDGGVFLTSLVGFVVVFVCQSERMPCRCAG